MIGFYPFSASSKDAKLWNRKKTTCAVQLVRIQAVLCLSRYFPFSSLLQFLVPDSWVSQGMVKAKICSSWTAGSWNHWEAFQDCALYLDRELWGAYLDLKTAFLFPGPRLEMLGLPLSVLPPPGINKNIIPSPQILAPLLACQANIS